MEERENTIEFRLRKDSSDAIYDNICTVMYKLWQKCKVWNDFVKITIEFYPEETNES